MTSKLTITDERVISVIERLEHYACNLKWTNVRGAQDLLTAADGLRELQERRKAAMDNEPVGKPFMYGIADPDGNAYIDEFCVSEDLGLVEDTVNELNYDREEGDELNYSVVALYRHAQPAPVVTFYRDGIEAAAKWIDQQREAYDSEHGWSDPDTGSFEFGSEIKREYSSTLEELAEGIRALHPNAGNSPVIPCAEQRIADAVELLKQAAPAMLADNGGPNGPLVGRLKSPAIPDGYVMVPKEPTQAMCAAFNDSDYGRKSLRERYVAMLAAAPQPQNAQQNIPEIIPGWIPVSERMPETDGNYWGWWSESKRQGPVWFIKSELQAQFQSSEITHWMPLPAAPQEAINALIPLVSRNEQEVK